MGRFGLLDKLMSEIPGKDNYPANVVDGALGQEAYSMDPEKDGQKLNAGYYHRWYKVMEKGAMGVQTRHRGFSDPNLFVAMTKQPTVAGIFWEGGRGGGEAGPSLTTSKFPLYFQIVVSLSIGNFLKKVPCNKSILFTTGVKLNVCKGKGKKKKCTKYEQKVSYAIPLEIIYLTPLNKWNPHNLNYKGDQRSVDGKTVTANSRNGGKTKTKAYDGVNSRIYYITPNEFFAGTETHVDAADTTKGSVGVLDPTKEVRMVRASGTRIFLPNIPGVGILRQRCRTPL
jgi:hypothetical protein